MSGILTPTPVMQWLGSGGLPLAFGTVHTYLAGTTTFLPAYSDLALTVPYGPSIALDAQGKAPIYLGPFTYKIDVQDQFGVSIDGYPRDNVPGQAFLGPFFDVKLFGAKGDGVTDDTVAIQAAITALSPSGSASAFGWALYFSPGRYRITATLLVTGNGYVRIFGDGVVSAILNQAPAGNPTFSVSSGRQNYLIEKLAIIGNVNFPNDGIVGAATAFGHFNELLLCPNGNGIHLSDSNTIAIDNCQYWPSGYNAGATKTPSLAKHAILGDGVTCNDIHIRWLNAVGYTTIANGGSAICFNPSSNADNISVRDCELEGTPPATSFAAFSFTKVVGFTLQDNFIENSTNTFIGCLYGTISQCECGSTGSLIFGDSTLGGRCGQVMLDSMAPNIVTFTANCYACGVQNCAITTFTNAGVQSYLSNTSATNEGTAIDRGFPFGLRERERTVAMGAWITPAFSAGIFTADTGAWTVIAGNVLVWSYTLVGKKMTLCFGFDSTTVTGGPTNRLIVTLPGGFVSNMRTEAVVRVFNNSGATAVPGSATVFATSNQMFFGPQQSSGGTFANSAGLCSIFGQISFEVV